MNTKERIKTIGGIQFEALRYKVPCPHWRVKVVQTGEVFEAGVFPSMGSLADLWESMERIAKARAELWAWDCGVGAHPKGYERKAA